MSMIDCIYSIYIQYLLYIYMIYYIYDKIYTHFSPGLGVFQRLQELVDRLLRAAERGLLIEDDEAWPGKNSPELSGMVGIYWHLSTMIINLIGFDMFLWSLHGQTVTERTGDWRALGALLPSFDASSAGAEWAPKEWANCKALPNPRILSTPKNWKINAFNFRLHASRQET